MIKVDEHALICDLAETYNIYDYKQLPLTTVAVFAYGLRNDSRIKMKLNGMSDVNDTLLLAKISDSLSTLVWHNTEDGHKGNNPPQKIVSVIFGEEITSNRNVLTFETGEDFIKQRQKLINKGGD